MNIEAVVHIAPAPSTPPAALAAYVTPVDADGVIVDWSLKRLELLSAPSGSGREVALEFGRWRSEFVWSRTLGEVRLLERFRDFALETAAKDDDLPLVSGLRFPGSIIGAGDAERFEDEIELVRQRLEASPLTGYGIFADDVRGHLYTGVAFDAFGRSEPFRIAAAANTEVRWEPGRGLVAAWHGEAGSTERQETIAAFGFDAPTTSFYLERPDGSRVEIDPVVGRLLAQLAPGAPRAKVHAIPLTSVWADAIVGLSAGALTAASVYEDLSLLER